MSLRKGHNVVRCVIPCAFFTIFLWRFNVTVTSKNDVPILAYFRLESGVFCIHAGINMNCLVSCGDFTGDMLLSEHRS